MHPAPANSVKYRTEPYAQPQTLAGAGKEAAAHLCGRCSRSVRTAARPAVIDPSSTLNGKSPGESLHGGNSNYPPQIDQSQIGERLLTLGQVAERLAVSRSTLHRGRLARLIDAGLKVVLIQSARPGRAPLRRYLASSLDELIRAAAATAAPIC